MNGDNITTLKQNSNEKLKINEQNYQAELIREVKADLFKRAQSRRGLENKWRQNINFVNGNQYCDIGKNEDLLESNKQYFWQEREVYNHIAEIVEVRTSKLTKNKPKMTVIPASSDSNDMGNARVCMAICDGLWHRLSMRDKIIRATNWAEICGTAFYKIVWNGELGEQVETKQNGLDNKGVHLGDIDVSVVSPFEIYPENLAFEKLEDNSSIIHAKAFSVSAIYDMYGVEVESEKVELFNLTPSNSINANAEINAKDYALVIEKYELPSKNYPNGRLVIVCSNKVLYEGELPFINGENGKRSYPFVKQVSMPVCGSFFGSSIVERLIPVQKSYNALKNRKNEFLNRQTMGVCLVEEGAVDIDNLEDEGLYPGKVLVYRQGANAPTFMDTTKLPTDFLAEEERLLNEFNTISGVSDLLRQTQKEMANLSGTALEILLEQDNARLSVTITSLEETMSSIAKQWLRLYKQFALFPRIMKIVGEKGMVDALFFSNSNISSDDVIIETEKDFANSKSQQRELILELIKSNILCDSEGNINETTRIKLLEMFGLGIYDTATDLNSLQIKYAQKENFQFANGVANFDVQEIDDDELHIKEHTAFLLSGEGEKLKGTKMYDNVISHIRKHKQRLKSINLNENK